jgi:hypothetical protein
MKKEKTLESIKEEFNKKFGFDIKNLDLENEATMYELFDYFCSKVDFSHSFLDNTAVCAMDCLFKNLDRERKVKFRN